MASTSALIVAAVIGAMLFFTAAVAPTLLKILPQEWTGACLRALFPKYYAALGAATLVAAALQPDPFARAVEVVCGGLFLFNLFLLAPWIQRARDAGQRFRFGLLHGLSFVLNLLQLAALLWMLWRNS